MSLLANLRAWLAGPVAVELQDALRRARRAERMARLDVGVTVAPPAPEAIGPHAPAEAAATAVDRAAAEWQRGVRDDADGAARIDLYIRGPSGLDWPSVEVGPDARPGVGYLRDGDFAWCGAFAAYVWASLRPEIRHRCMASCYRLHAWARGTDRIVEPSQARGGDLLLCGDGSPVWGTHIAIARGAWDGREIPTIEGNAVGWGPDGSRYEGVIQRSRPLVGGYRVLHAIRPLAGDLGV